MTAQEPRRITRLAQAWIEPALYTGAHAIDATAGTGADTLFLARGVGPGGRVHAFDLQCRALQRARRRLSSAGLACRVRWYRASHVRMRDYVGGQRAMAIMFNLGWLPGSDGRCLTQPASTIAALDAARACLAPGGRLSIVAYRGHSGGPEENDAVARWFAEKMHGATQRLTAWPPEPASATDTAPILYRLQASPGATDTNAR